MKIISKYKDYYDYLQGIWGVDEKLILDRTEFFVQPYTPSNGTLIRFHICGYQVEGIFWKGEYLYGTELERFLELKDKPSKFYRKKIPNKFRQKDDRYYNFSIQTDFSSKYVGYEILKSPVLFKEIPRKEIYYQSKVQIHDPNDFLECPILIENGKEHKVNGISYAKFPILEDYQFHKVFSAEKIWLMLTEYLGREKVLVNNQTNSEKILSNGFDLKSSFRNPIK